jgi:hypothetical protein
MEVIVAVGDGRYRAEVPAADQRLMEQVGVGPSDWFVNSHDAMPVYSDTLVAAIKALESDPVAPAEESSSSGAV